MSRGRVSRDPRAVPLPGEEKLHVLQVIGRMNVGGPARLIVTLAQGLDPDRFEHRVLTGSVDASEADFLDLTGTDLPATRLGSLGRAPGLADLRALAGIAAEIRRFRPHIVHTHTAKAGVLGRMAALSQRVPITVHTFHGHLLGGYFPLPVTRAVTGAERVLARRTDRLVAVGRQVRDELLAAGIGRPAQYSIIPPGVDFVAGPGRQQARLALGLSPSAPVVAFVGRLTGVKRVDRLLGVAERSRRSWPDAVFLVVGEGPLSGALRAQAAAMGGRVRFLGWRGDVGAVYDAADVVALTSDNEGMPLSLVEAALAGRPVVATNVGSVPEVVADGLTGVLVAPDSDKLFEAMDGLLADPARRKRMGEAAKERAQRLFSPAQLVSDTEGMYEELVLAHHVTRTG